MSASNPEQISRFLCLSNDVGKRAISLDHHPFGAVLVVPDHERIFG
ncbi:cytidine/deoxycytidylate deaminase family protein [Acinetobacter sp. ANC 4636]